MPAIHMSHDAYFKTIFQNPTVAADALRRLLPPALAEAIDWDELELMPAEFIDADLSAHRADLIFRVPLRGQTAFLFVLYEHQSSVDAMMPFRVLVYMVGAWKEWRRENPDAKHLPPIVPVVLYHGERAWNAPLDLHALFAVEPAVLAALAPHLPAFSVLLDDLTRVGDDEIEHGTQKALATVALLMLDYPPTSRKPCGFADLAILSRISARITVPSGAVGQPRLPVNPGTSTGTWWGIAACASPPSSRPAPAPPFAVIQGGPHSSQAINRGDSLRNGSMGSEPIEIPPHAR